MIDEQFDDELYEFERRIRNIDRENLSNEEANLKLIEIANEIIAWCKEQK